MMIGSLYPSNFSSGKFSLVNPSNNKLVDLLYLVQDQYVDSVDIQDLVERSLPHVLKELDPHSAYFSASEVDASMEQLNGSFSGVGIQFSIYSDTLRVAKVIDGGPADKAGVHPGDRIIAINGYPYVGSKVTNDETLKLLKGAKGSSVTIKVRRPGSSNDINFSIVRGDVPIKSVDSYYMIDKHTGYMRINAWGSTTFAEFLSNMVVLNTHGADNLILDLRGNGGGYLDAAVQVANEFLPKGQLIVYTEGRRAPRENYTSDGRGSFRNMGLVVLVDEFSASASEIFAGAMQDNDRAVIIGRRTFGKGLVQIPIEFPDGSMLRLTRARYYTPSGRCVQKPYTPGDENYDNDLLLRADAGEYYSPEAIKLSGPKYRTTGGRIVYGGGGIVPDHFIPRDTTGYTSYFRDVYYDGQLQAFAYGFVDKHRARLQKMSTHKEVSNFLQGFDLVEEFVLFAEANGTKRRNLMIEESRKVIKEVIVNCIMGDVLSVDQAVQFVNLTDPAVQKGLELIRNGKSRP